MRFRQRIQNWNLYQKFALAMITLGAFSNAYFIYSYD